MLGFLSNLPAYSTLPFLLLHRFFLTRIYSFFSLLLIPFYSFSNIKEYDSPSQIPLFHAYAQSDIVTASHDVKAVAKAV